MERKKILWLASWYPNRIDPLDGDFIQRHARAVSLYHDVHVLFVVRDKNRVTTETVLSENFENGNLSEELIYYAIANGPLHKAFSQLRYNQLFKKAIQQYIRENGQPDLVHVHVTLKAGWLARWMKKKWRIPYIITEHSSIYLPEAEETFTQLPFYLRAACTHIWKGAASVSTVSQYLYGHLKNLMPGTEMRVIPNVVNTTIFQPGRFKNAVSGTRFIHISGLGHPKNAEAIVNAFAFVAEKNSLFELHIFGPQHPQLMQLVHSLHLDAMVTFHEEVPQPQLAQHLQRADALVLYSRYETFGCVVIEANACGVPVIVSDIPTMHELVAEGVNGVFVPRDDVPALGEKLIWFSDNRSCFDMASIARRAQERYDYKTVGLQFSEWYQAVLAKQKR